MHGRSHGDESPNGFRVQKWALRVLLSWDPHLLEHVPGEERATPVILLAGPVQRRLEHPKIPLNCVGSNETPRHPPAAAPYDVLVNPIRRQLGDYLVMSEELGQVTASLPD